MKIKDKALKIWDIIQEWIYLQDFLISTILPFAII